MLNRVPLNRLLPPTIGWMLFPADCELHSLIDHKTKQILPLIALNVFIFIHTVSQRTQAAVITVDIEEKYGITASNQTIYIGIHCWCEISIHMNMGGS